MPRQPDRATDGIGWLFVDFLSEGFTPIPHDLLDWIAPVLSEAELRVLLYICRRSYGFGKKSDFISLNQFCAGPTSRSGTALDLGTGLSRQGVLNGIQGLQGKGLLKVVAGRGRSQVNQYEIHLPPESLARIEELQVTPRELVNTVDLLRRSPGRRFPHSEIGADGSQKGQPPRSQKVNFVEKSPPKKVYAVHPQEKAITQEKESRQEKVGFAQNGPITSNKPDPFKEDIEEKLEHITGQRLRSSERAKLRALDRETASKSMDTFSTETHWIDLPNKNAAFLSYLQRLDAERSNQEHWDEAEGLSEDD